MKFAPHPGQSALEIWEHVSAKHKIPSNLGSHVETKYGGLRVSEYRPSPASSIDLKGVSQTLKGLEKAGKAATLYSVYDNAKAEFESRGITSSSLINAWTSAPQSVVFAFQNPDAGLKALSDGLNSASAVSIRFATFGLVEVHGTEVEKWVNLLAKAQYWKSIYEPGPRIVEGGRADGNS